MKTFKDEPYLFILGLCVVGTIIAIIIEYFDAILATLGGGVVLFITLVLPVAIISIIGERIFKLLKRK